MRRHIDSLLNAANSLAVRIEGPIIVTLPSGHVIAADAYFPDFGGPRGQLVCSNYDEHDEIREFIRNSGYGISYFYAPQDGMEFTENDLMELLRDWMWNGPSDKKPQWC